MKQFSIQLLCLIMVSCPLWGQKTPTLALDTLRQQILVKLPQSLGTRLIVPKDSPIESSMVELGRRIFFDPILSRDGTVACASCHRPGSGFASQEAIAVGIGGQIGRRNSPTLLNRGFGGPSFWDGRVISLEAQVLEPISNPTELGHSLPGVLEALRANLSYRQQFRLALDRGKDDPRLAITSQTLSRALATFLRSLVLGDSPVDRFHGGEAGALTQVEKRGLWLFESRGGCWQCHSGFNFTDESFHNTGVSMASKSTDLGRFGITKRKKDLRAFKTPTLRGVAKTAPYMHDGSLMTLRDVIEFYNRGGDRKDPALDRRLRPLNLDSNDIDAMVALLEALSRNQFDSSRKSPAMPKSH